jgi:hypothetical protein
MIGVAAGCMLDQDLPAPAVSVFEESKPTWMTIPSVAHYQQGPASADLDGALWAKFRGA